MRILTTDFDTEYCCAEVARGYLDVYVTIHMVLHEMGVKYRRLDKTMVAFLGCPCCSRIGVEIPVDAILVSPLCGIDKQERKIRTNDVRPRFKRDSGKEEGVSHQEFRTHWEKVIEDAIKEACPEFVLKKEPFYPHNF